MVDTPFPPKVPKVFREIAAERAEATIRTIIGGAPIAAVRRIVLYLFAGVALVFAPVPAEVVGLLAILLLVATDVLR